MGWHALFHFPWYHTLVTLNILFWLLLGVFHWWPLYLDRLEHFIKNVVDVISRPCSCQVNSTFALHFPFLCLHRYFYSRLGLTFMRWIRWFWILCRGSTSRNQWPCSLFWRLLGMHNCKGFSFPVFVAHKNDWTVSLL